MAAHMWLVLSVRNVASQVCIFDIDMTLTRGMRTTKSKCNASLPSFDFGLPGVFAKQAVEGCLSRGFQVGISTAEPFLIGMLRKEFLSHLVPDLFNEAFFASKLMQYGSKNKTPGLLAILAHINSSAKCAIFFDDRLGNAEYAEAVGISFQQASDDKNDGETPVLNSDCGLNFTQFVSGMNKIPPSCHAN